mmetsp:Transcript_4292/g.12465  ORF Transcript_4292/g.12465 Transcript_4292/m.12465 type:complete len:205 (+) Transcript_4292:107-721(+)
MPSHAHRRSGEASRACDRCARARGTRSHNGYSWWVWPRVGSGCRRHSMVSDWRVLPPRRPVQRQPIHGRECEAGAHGTRRHLLPGPVAKPSHVLSLHTGTRGCALLSSTQRRAREARGGSSTSTCRAGRATSAVPRVGSRGAPKSRAGARASRRRDRHRVGHAAGLPRARRGVGDRHVSGRPDLHAPRAARHRRARRRPAAAAL